MADELLSIGIDIGTSTTQVIFSRLSIENTSGYFSVPQIRIVDKQVIYKGEVHSTPLKTRTMIDADAVALLVEGEFKRAGFTPRDTRTGAVIITGETARKDNAALVLERLSGFAGDFVVSTAGRTWNPSLRERAAGPVSIRRITPVWRPTSISAGGLPIWLSLTGARRSAQAVWISEEG